MERDPLDSPADILLVEDNPGDVRLTREAFDEAQVENDLHEVSRGSEALEYLHQRGAYDDVSKPDLVLLDLNLPGMDGFKVLDRIRGASELRDIPVIVLTSSEAEEDVARSYQEYANAYMTKPIDADRFVEIARSISDFWIQLAELPPADS